MLLHIFISTTIRNSAVYYQAFANRAHLDEALESVRMAEESRQPFPTEIYEQYGPLKAWDVGGVESLGRLFVGWTG